MFVSFWHIGLENIPEGSFVHRRLAPTDARGLIDEARRAGTLRCACHDDLFAPYHEDERREHSQLCRVLGEHHGIALSLEDFTIDDDVEGEDCCTIRPLAFADIDGSNRLMVVRCHYVMPSEREADSRNRASTLMISSSGILASASLERVTNAFHCACLVEFSLAQVERRGRRRALVCA